MSKEEINIEDQILQTIDIMIGMVLESKGKFNRNTMTIPMEMDGHGSYELVLTFKEKGLDQ